MPVIIGGIEASLRRFAHYDYWEGKLLPSILADSHADLLIYGMGEKQITEAADYLAAVLPCRICTISAVRAYLADSLEGIDDYVEIPSYERA